ETVQPSVTSFSANVPLPAQVGTSLTWTVSAIGGTPPLQYQFLRSDAGVWRIVQDYSTSNTYAWVPGSGDVGQHAIQVLVRNAGAATWGAQITANFSITGTPLTVTKAGTGSGTVTSTPTGIACGTTC